MPLLVLTIFIPENCTGLKDPSPNNAFSMSFRPSFQKVLYIYTIYTKLGMQVEVDE